MRNPQGMLQVLLNHLVFGMDIQPAIEAPRFSTHSQPNSFEPHEAKPGRLVVEKGIAPEVGAELAARGHDVEWHGPRSDAVAGVCAISANLETGLIGGGADPRRSGRAMGCVNEAPANDAPRLPASPRKRIEAVPL